MGGSYIAPGGEVERERESHLHGRTASKDYIPGPTLEIIIMTHFVKCWTLYQQEKSSSTIRSKSNCGYIRVARLRKKRIEKDRKNQVESSRRERVSS